MFGAQPVSKVKQVSKYGGPKALPDDPMEGFKAAIALPPANVPLAPFFGQYTAILATSGNGFVMARQSDCSLSAANIPYSQTPSSPYSAPDSTTANYNQVLHSDAGLTTTAGLFTGGCNDPKIGIESNDLLYAGVSTGGMRMAAAAEYDASSDNNVLYTFVMKDDGTYVSTTTQPLGANGPWGVVAGDLNGDGNPDIVAIGFQTISSQGSPSDATMISVLLGNADGTFTVGQTYTLTTGLLSDSAVIDDFDGDGKLDVVVAEGGFSPNNASGKLTFLRGNGDGTLAAPVSLALNRQYVEGLISGDFDNDTHKDIMSSTGYFFHGTGDPTNPFTAPSGPAFPMPGTNHSGAAGLTAGHFIANGKNLDLAVGTGDTIAIFLGNGDGTFTTGNVYSSIDNRGGVMATDLDGDGNLDIYSGNAQAGIFSGDDFTAGEGYALMGHGDGTFAGAPVVNYASFVSLQDINGDGKLDFIGLSGASLTSAFNPVFSTYFGNGDGTFHAGAAGLNATNFTYQGTQYQINQLDSYATVDINGDGRPDLVYFPTSTTANYPVPNGFLSAISNADGSFQTPVYNPAQSYAVGGGQDHSATVNGVVAAANQAGKPELIYGYTDQTVDSSANVVTYYSGYATQLANGDGTFAAPVPTVVASTTDPSQAFPQEPPLLLTDLNNDKIPDLIIFTSTPATNGGTATNSLAVMLGNADGTFAAPVILSVPNPSLGYDNTPVAVGDVNGDGIPDIVTSGVPNGTGAIYYLAVLLGKGDGTFTAQPPLYGPGIGTGSIAIADFTGDGKADIAYTTFQNAPGNYVYPGNGDGTFQGMTTSATGTPAVQPLTLALGTGNGPSAAYDVNGDGKMDLVAANTILLQTTAPSGTTTGTGTTGTAASTTTLTAAPTSVVAGASVTLTAAVTGPTGNTTVPTGTVTFLDGTTSLGTGTLSGSGTATLAVTTLPVGAQSITAAYGGDTNFAASTSSAVTVTVTAPIPDYAISLSPTSGSIKAGASATTTISIQPSNGFNSAVTFTCSGLPTGGSCTFSPSTVTPSGTGAATTSLTISTTSAAARLAPAEDRFNSRTMVLWAAFLLSLGILTRSRRQWQRASGRVWGLVLIAVLAGVTALSGCGGSGNKSTTSSVTVTATSGTTTHTATFSLTVD